MVPVLPGPFHLELLTGTCWVQARTCLPAGQLTPLLLAQGPEPSQPAGHLMADPKPGAGMGESMALQGVLLPSGCSHGGRSRGPARMRWGAGPAV